ncbi:MAG TPA: response regulator [Kofleriaceae bacterium]|nr:response regulator [Kofleriaceae bacterium]
MTALPLLLVVDDDDRLRERLAAAIAERGYRTKTAAHRDAAVAIARDEHVDRAVVDLRMPGAHGLVVVQDLLAIQPAMEIVVLTGYGSIATAVEAMQLGARHYLTKPANADQILSAFVGEPGGVASELPFEVPSLAKVEREHIERVLRECGGNISKSARLLGMNRRTLQYKLAKFPVKR